MQSADFSSTCTLSSSYVVNNETLVLLLFGFLLIYCSTASFEKIGSLTISVSSLTKLLKSVKSGSLLCLLLIVKAFLDHLPLAVPGNFDSNMHIMLGVSNTFQL